MKKLASLLTINETVPISDSNIYTAVVILEIKKFCTLLSEAITFSKHHIINNQIFITLADLQSNLHYAEACNEWRGSSPPISAWQHIFEETSQRLPAASDFVSDLTSPRIEPMTSRTVSRVFNHCAKRPG